MLGRILLVSEHFSKQTDLLPVLLLKQEEVSAERSAAKSP